MTEFWKIAHMGTCEIIRMFMFNWLPLIILELTILLIKSLFIILCIGNGLKLLTSYVDLHKRACYLIIKYFRSVQMCPLWPGYFPKFSHT